MKHLLVGCFSIALAGCISTQEMPLAPNMVRIDTDARGMLFAGQAVPQTMRAAAKATLDRGYTRFRFADVSATQGSEVAGLSTTSNTTVLATANGLLLNGSATNYGTDNVIRRPTTHTGATVIMLHDTDPGAKDAFDAATVMKQYNS